MSQKIPLYDICNLHDEKETKQDVVVMTLHHYLEVHPHLIFPHRHSFYQLLFITHTGGRHIIDFETHIVEKGTLYILLPGQIHEWLFTAETEGIIINLSEGLFGNCLAASHYLRNQLFFTGKGRQSVVDFSHHFEKTNLLFAQLLEEYNHKEAHFPDMIRALLLQLFVTVTRQMNDSAVQKFPYQYKQLAEFEKLLEENFTTKRLPKEYAELLFITPNHLNALCVKLLGRPSGEIIRDRILLEAKRMLVNSDYTISEISSYLNFETNSYFSRFFKKKEGITPDRFRKEHFPQKK